MRARDLGLACGSLPPGARNTIADVAGVGVGHTTLNEGDIHTGVTAIVPHPGDPFRDKLPAAAVVLNGFGKSIGLMQLNELGTLETPILLSNTFAVGNCANALIRGAIATNPEIGRRTGTVNPVVLECNDGYLNDIQAMAVTEAHACAAIETVQADFARGNVGAGTGMSCFGFKGGIGSASRRLRLDDTDHHLGVLVLANFGNAGDLVLPTGQVMGAAAARVPEAGSCIVVIGTDIPLEYRQLRRVAARAGVGLAWCGSFWGTASGDIALAFTTASRVPDRSATHLRSQGVMTEQCIDLLFRAAAEATEEAVFDALAAADTLEGRDGHRRISLRENLRR
jgi:D-aminopeptidase